MKFNPLHSPLTQDILRCLIQGASAAGILAVLGGLFGGIFSGDILQGIVASLFIAGSAGLVLGAYLILKDKTRDPEKHGWRKKYRVLTPQGVVLLISVIPLAVGSLIDWLRYPR